MAGNILFNLKRTHELMKYYNIDSIIFTDPVSLKYFGFDLFFNLSKEWMLKPGAGNNNGTINYCIIPLNKKPIYLLSAFAISSLDTEIFEEIVPFGKFMDFKNSNASVTAKNKIDLKLIKLFSSGIFNTPMDAISYVLKKYNLEHAKIALEEEGLNKDIAQNIKNVFNKCNFFDGSVLIKLIRMVKTEKEIAIIKRCLELTEIAMLDSLKTINSSCKFGGIKKKFKGIVFKEDAVYEHFFIFPNGLGMNDSDSYLIENNKIMGFDAGIIYKKYISDAGLTLFNGQYDKNELETYKKLFAIIQSGAQKVKPGAKCLDIYKAMVEARDKYGFKNAFFEGHGIGLSFREYPIINGNMDYQYYDGFADRSANFTLEKNMVFNFELGLHIPNIKTFQIEKTFVVSENGYREFDFQNRSEPLFI